MSNIFVSNVILIYNYQISKLLQPKVEKIVPDKVCCSLVFVQSGTSRALHRKTPFFSKGPIFLWMYVCQIFFNISPGLWGTCTNSVNWGCDRTSFGQEILPPIMSGKVTSHAAIKYGRVNVRARIPRGDWIWPGSFCCCCCCCFMNTV